MWGLNKNQVKFSLIFLNDEDTQEQVQSDLNKILQFFLKIYHIY